MLESLDMHVESEQPALPGTETVTHGATKALVVAKAHKVRCRCLSITGRE
jgi:hypothetical protein